MIYIKSDTIIKVYFVHIVIYSTRSITYRQLEVLLSKWLWRSVSFVRLSSNLSNTREPKV